MFVPRGPINNKIALAQVMAWHQRGAKPLPEPLLTQFTDIFVVLGGDESVPLCNSVLGKSNFVCNSYEHLAGPVKLNSDIPISPVNIAYFIIS